MHHLCAITQLLHLQYEEHCSLHLGAQVCLGAALGISKPSSLLWFKSDLFTYALGFLMLSMGLTLTFDDFRQARSAQPFYILAGPVIICLHTATMQQYLRLRSQQGGKIRFLLYICIRGECLPAHTSVLAAVQLSTQQA